MPGDPILRNDPADTIRVLSESGTIFTHICKGEQVPVPQSSSDDAIQSLREELPTRPQEASLALANALLTRFVLETHSTDDCEEGIAVLDKLIASIPPEDNEDQYHAQAAEMIALLALARSIMYSDPGYSEEAVLRCRTALSFSSLDGQPRIVLTQALAIHAEQRFKYFGRIDDLQEAITLVPEIVNLLSSGEGVGELYTSKRAYPIGTVVEKIEHLEGLLLETTTGSPCQRTYLEDLACWYDTKFSRTSDLPDIKMAIRYRRMLLAPPFSDHPFSFISLSFLCDDLLIAFGCTGFVDYLDESIILHHNLLTMQDAKALHFAVLRRLVPALCVRYHLLRRRQDLDEMMRLFPIAADDRYVSVADRFKFSCLWAFLARHFGHSSVSSAYESAISLSRSSLAFGPTIQVQQARLVGMSGTCEGMPLDYASYQISTGCVEQAIETLERGRALLWSEMRGFRSSIDQPNSSYLQMAERLTSLNRELETLTVSATQPTLGFDMDDGSRVGLGGPEGNQIDPFCHLVTEQRTLSKERDALISDIRSLPGFADFLSPPSFDALRSAASRGPVIIINHSKWRCDILILLHDSPPSLITTPSDFYDRANGLKNRLLFARGGAGHGGDFLSTRWHAYTVRTVLADLYALVGRVVLQRLRALNVPEQSRIWWCPTSAFCFLPLHAMGPIPSADGTASEQYFCDLYIPSYTPTLSALIESRKPITRRPSPGRWERPKHPLLLLVAYHEDNLGGMQKEIKAIQGLRRTKVKSLVGENVTKAAVIEGLEQHRFVHISGSVKLVPGRPLDAPFRLHGDDRLTLLDIARCRLPSAEFAFLSASHAAELTDLSHPDEALHLTAAMQHCGFRSVVGTMWAMADMDGRDLCKRFYKLMFEEKGQKGVPYHERAAKALRDAVQKLRKKKDVTVDCWVTYVHYGA